MRILFLTYDFPYPLNAGGKIRSYYLIKGLAQKHQISLFSYYRNDDQKHDESQLKKYCQEIYWFKRRPVWSGKNILLACQPKLPFASATYYSQEVKETMHKVLKTNKYQAVHFESFYPALYLPLVKKLRIKTVLGNQNREYLIYQRLANQKQAYLKWLLSLEVKRMKYFEQSLWKQADLNLAPSKEDVGEITRVTGRKCWLIPNGVVPENYQIVNQQINRQTIMFIGDLVYQANQNAIKYFLDKIYPLIKKSLPEIKFLLVSASCPNWLNNYLTDSTIKLIQDRQTPASQLLPQADVFVVPIRVAGGTRIKILEAMAAGLSVVTTTVGLAGIGAINNQEAIIADQPEDFAKAVVDLLNHKSKRLELGQAGRKLVELRYNWSNIGQQLLKAYESL